jgi:hypothetical protein
MRSWRTAVSIVAFAIAGAFATTTAFAAEINLGKHSQGEIRDACNAAGGELLGVSDSGSYGCEVASTGGMILCNKNNDCTGYTPARTRSQGQRILNTLRLKGTATVKSSGGKPNTGKPDTTSPGAKADNK